METEAGAGKGAAVTQISRHRGIVDHFCGWLMVLFCLCLTWGQSGLAFVLIHHSCRVTLSDVVL